MGRCSNNCVSKKIIDTALSLDKTLIRAPSPSSSLGCQNDPDQGQCLLQMYGGKKEKCPILIL